MEKRDKAKDEKKVQTEKTKVCYVWQEREVKHLDGGQRGMKMSKMRVKELEMSKQIHDER